MRKVIEKQMQLGEVDIANIKFDLKSPWLGEYRNFWLIPPEQIQAELSELRLSMSW